MKALTCYIVDDEPLAVKSLKMRLEEFPELVVIGEATRMAKAIADIGDKNPDILFLDIQLSEGTGFDLLDQLNYSGKIVFVTAFDEYAFRAFGINALDYLLKPVSQERIKAVVAKIKSTQCILTNDENSESNYKYKYGDRILILEKNQIRFVLLDSVNLISASRDYTIVETIDGKKSLMTRSMAEWVNRLPEQHFIRIHRSYIVNMNHIEKIVRNSTCSARVFLRNHPEPVTLSRTYYSILRERYF
jgi:two-component system, LytTR family, response regulator